MKSIQGEVAVCFFSWTYSFIQNTRGTTKTGRECDLIKGFSVYFHRNSSGEFIFSLVWWQLQSPMKLSSLITSTSVFIFIILEIRVLLLPWTAVPWWYNMTRQMKDLNAHIVQSGLSFKIDGIAKLLYPIDLSAINLARVMSSSKKK